VGLSLLRFANLVWKVPGLSAEVAILFRDPSLRAEGPLLAPEMSLGHRDQETSNSK
jgi:hypothetical protein